MKTITQQISSNRRAWLLSYLTIAAVCFVISSLASEYEVDGKITQIIIEQNGSKLSASASFTVFFRDCGWLIESIETDEHGNVVSRKIGSTNRTEIYECTQSPNTTSGPMFGMIVSNNIPVGWLDSAVVGHLWLMFASQCHWPTLNSDQLTPVYDWRASVGAHGQNRKVSAEWNLLNGPGSLPQKVMYFGPSDKTNGLYSITGTNSAGRTLIPAGFVFEQYQNSKLIKHVDVEVIAVRPVCSRASLIPSPDGGAIIIDMRFDSGLSNHLPTYRNPVSGQWATIEEAKQLAGDQNTAEVGALNREGLTEADSALSSSKTVANTPVLSLSIRCTNAIVKAGDEISIEFRITNRGTNDYKYPDRTYDRSGRMNEYRLIAKNESGDTVPDPRSPGKDFWMGGLFQYQTLKPGQSFTKTISLNRWALIKEPGRYMVIGTNFVESRSTNSITVSSDPIPVEVQARTTQEMDAYINNLTNQLEAKLTGNSIGTESRPPDRALNELVMKLMFTCNPQIVPSLLKSMYDYGSGGGFWESEGIKFYVPHSTEVRKAIIEAATKHGLGPNWTMSSLLKDYGCTKEEMKPLIEKSLRSDNEQEWAAGAGLAEKFSDDAFTERLIAIAMTPRSNARIAAITALAYNRSDEGVKTLKKLFDDPHEKIWTPLAFAIQNAYNSRRDSIGRPLRPDDFTAEDMKPLIGRLLAQDNQNPGLMTGAGLIGRFGGDDFTTRLIAIATSADSIARDSAIYALALNRSDAGVNTLQALLDDPDQKTRTTTENAIRNAYASRGNARGRPLRPEDFDAKFRQPK